MTKITSIADFLYKIKKDEEYKRLLIYACKTSRGLPYTITYEVALDWLEKWIAVNTKEYNCEAMVNFLNNCMKELPVWPTTLISAQKINTFEGKRNPYLPK